MRRDGVGFVWLFAHASIRHCQMYYYVNRFCFLISNISNLSLRKKPWFWNGSIIFWYGYVDVEKNGSLLKKTFHFSEMRLMLIIWNSTAKGSVRQRFASGIPPPLLRECRDNKYPQVKSVKNLREIDIGLNLVRESSLYTGVLCFWIYFAKKFMRRFIFSVAL